MLPRAGRTSPVSIGSPAADPGAQASVEHAHVGDAAAVQEPPRSGRGHGLHVVVGHDDVAIAKPPPPRGVLEIIARRERMPPLGRLALAGQFVVEIDVDRPRQVAVEVLRATLRAVQAPAHVEHADGSAGGEQTGEFGRGDQKGHHPMVPRRVDPAAVLGATVRHTNGVRALLRSTMEGCPRPRVPSRRRKCRPGSGRAPRTRPCRRSTSRTPSNSPRSPRPGSCSRCAATATSTAAPPTPPCSCSRSGSPRSRAASPPRASHPVRPPSRSRSSPSPSRASTSSPPRSCTAARSISCRTPSPTGASRSPSSTRTTRMPGGRRSETTPGRSSRSL